MNDFIDTISITDEIGPHGLVVIKDKDGNILVKKHNMVVKNGKDIVFRKLLHETSRMESNDLANYKLHALYFGDSMNETTFGYSEIDRLDDGNGGYNYSFAIDGSSSIKSVSYTSDGHPYIEFNLASILCDPTIASYLSCLSITANKIVKESNSNDDDEILFSRIKFDPIPMIEGNELTLLYYIYF